MRKSNYNLLILLGIFLISLSYISAEILFTQQVNSVYNLGDEIFVPLKIKSVSEVIGVLELNLICNNNSLNFYKNGIKLKAGEEKSFDSYLVLIKEIIGTEKGKCNIKAVFNEEYSLSEEFRISDLLIINPEITSYEFDVGQSLEITGRITKENSQGLEGFLEVRILDGNNNIKLDQTQTVSQGNINSKLTLPNDLESKEYVVKFLAYERDLEGKIINEGQTEKTIYIKQLPTHLEINTNFDEIIPGDYLKISSKLKDQTNKEINSTTLFILKDSQDKILEQKEIVNGEELEYLIPEKEAPAVWKIIAQSKNINSEKNISIKEIEKIAIDIVNKTLILTNEGNIPYNKTLLVRIEETPINVNVELKVGETKKYTLSAPEGEYDIKLMTGEGQEVSHTLSLTGRAISVKEEKNVSFSVIGWTILIIILLFFLFRLVKKLHKKRFVGRVKRIKNKDFKKDKQTSSFKELKELPTLNNSSISNSVNKAELCLSMKGAEQDSSAVCLKIKNLKDKAKGSVLDTLNKIKDISQENKGVLYENQDYLIFLFAPIKTKTLRNESIALNFAEKVQNILSDHNSRFNQKIEEYGLSIDNGTIIAKLENNIFKFMAMGNLITSLKKISSLSNKETLLSQRMNDLLVLKIKSSREIREGVTVYTMLSVKKEDEATTKFINRFLNRQKD